jgi:DNA mismatch repair protein MutL
LAEIKLLDSYTINQIAAGEVVERPASVIKELVENSIDAKASAIAIEIKDGGISLIRVTDNGSGIEKDQVKIAFLRHATSKIETAADITSIYSLGFRGEALASIASVSQLEMITKTYKDITGSRIEIHGGDIIAQEDIGCPNGTTLIIKNLFYNTPARQKFLKKPQTEAGYISEIISKLALGHPEISFKFINNGTVQLHTSGNNNLKTVALNIYGKEVLPKLLDLEYNIEGFELKGLIAKPEISRSNRTYENLYINGRFIKSDLIAQAVEQAYKTRIMVGKFPMYILNLMLPPYEYDVNVHPTKLEVRFNKENIIYNMVYESVLEELSKQNMIPKVSIEAPKKEKESSTIVQQAIPEPFEVTNKNLEKKEPLRKEPQKLEAAKQHPKPEPQNAQANKNEPINEPIKQPSALYETKEAFILDSAKPQKPLSDYKIVGQVFNTYWIIEQNNSMFMIDQHAAHERILYEKFLDNYNSKIPMSQLLLQPLTVKLSLKEKQILKDNIQIFEALGFELEEFGEDTYIARSVPVIFNKPENINFLLDVLDILSETTPNTQINTKLDKIASISCKAAVKANDKLSEIEAQKLLDELCHLENPFNCPHGRPTIIELTKYEIEKKFKRIQ